MNTRFLVLQHDADDPPMLIEQWIAEAGAEIDLRRLYLGDPIPESTAGYAGLICMGGEMGAWDDEVAPWLPATRELMAAAVRDRTPTLGVCLGSQLLAAATGGTVEVAPDGPEIGTYLTAKRDAAEADPLFAALPMTPDVMHFHYDVVSQLPPGAVLLLSSNGYPHQAFRIGSAAWGLQFHIEAPAEVVRDWARKADLPLEGRLGPALDEAAEVMAVVWRDFIHRFVALARDDRAAVPGRRLPLVSGDA